MTERSSRCQKSWGFRDLRSRWNPDKSGKRFDYLPGRFRLSASRILSNVSSSRQVLFDDVVHAYRWILGREPETIDILHKQALAGTDLLSLRAILLNSPEFKDQLLNIQIEDFCSRAEPDILSELTTRLVFVHIPRSGGTTLHHILADAVSSEKVCCARHNTLWLCSGADLASARLFSGHYDRNCVAFVPGREIKVVTILREPRRRLLSLYDYLRAHRPRAIDANNLALAAAARKYKLSDFLEAAVEINPAAVDNTYLRAFGGRLPFHRWEQAAEPHAPRTLSDFGCSVEDLCDRAADFLQSMATVGILEQFDTSLRAIFSAFHLDAPKSVTVRQRLADIVQDNEMLEPIEPYALSHSEELRIDELTKYDLELYKLGKVYLAESIGLQTG